LRPIDTVKVCQEYFDFDLPSVMIEKNEKRKKTFLTRFDTLVCLVVKIY